MANKLATVFLLDPNGHGHAESPENYDRLQVCDADLNAVTARVTAGIAFISKVEWNRYGDEQKISYISDVIDMFLYMQFGQTAKSYNAAYKALILFWQTTTSVRSRKLLATILILR